jgi:hypothetical protein
MLNQSNETQNVVRLPISQRNPVSRQSKGWSYLLSDSLAFNKEMDYGIRIQKPNLEKMPKWIEKIVTSGQCNTLYVENLTLKEADKQYIEGLCHQHNVSLFSLSVVQEKQNKVVYGPW